jgi:hypothetical protein
VESVLAEENFQGWIRPKAKVWNWAARLLALGGFAVFVYLMITSGREDISADTSQLLIWIAAFIIAVSIISTFAGMAIRWRWYRDYSNH